MMDIALLATLVKVLAPCLPFLQGLATKAVEKGSEKLGEKGAEGLVQLPLAQKLWDKLLPKVKGKEGVKEVAEDVAKAPDNEVAVAALQYQLGKILGAPENKALAAEITALLMEDEASPGAPKYDVDVDGIVGAIGDRNTVTQHIGSKLQA